MLIEDKITLFEKKLKEKHQVCIAKNQKTNPRNLNPLQINTLHTLCDNKDLIIKPTDKNLGPAIMDTKHYIRKVLQEHLLTKDYQELSKEEATYKLENTKNTLKNIILSNLDCLSKPETTYFKRSLTLRHRIPLFYGIPKVHKTPFTLRPVVSTTNSLLSGFSTWLDYRMKDLLPLVQSI
jgi:hypothetical protein